MQKYEITNVMKRNQQWHVMKSAGNTHSVFSHYHASINYKNLEVINI